MRSAELARLAGVTVRSLRHYHHLGILAEPERRANGYRTYDVHDLIRVLRIRRLASVGIPLERMAGLLDNTDRGAAELLDELDGELASQIDRLARQRDLIALLRAHGAAPDLPPELAPFLTLLGTGVPPEIARVDRDQSVLMAHLVGEEGIGQLTRFYERLSDPELAPVVVEMSTRFGALSPDDSDEQIQGFINRFVGVVAPLLAEFANDTGVHDWGAASGLLGEYTAAVLNEQQKYVLAQVEERLERVHRRP